MLKRAALGVLAAVALVGLVGVHLVLRHGGRGRDSLAALPVGASLVRETYAQDAAVGEKIMKKMAGRVHNPMWSQLMGSKKMRTALAAAIGAERLAPGTSAASAFNLGNLLSGLPHRKREQVKQQLRLRSLPHSTAHRFERVQQGVVSPRREWDDARLRGRSRGRWRRALRSRAAARERARLLEPAMPNRMAANGWQQALSPPHTRAASASRVLSVKSHRPKVLHTKFVFDEFAPGVLPGDSAHTVHPTAVEKPASPAPAAVKRPQKMESKHMSPQEAVEKATGFGDTIVKVQDSAEDKLKKEVQHLQAMNAEEKREFEKREKVRGTI